MDIWERLVSRDMPHGHLELLDRAADEIARLRAALASEQKVKEPVFLEGAISDAYDTGWRPEGFGG